MTGGVRFAPSPTGRFHVGNLRTAWISEKWARATNLKWVVRFEDIDRPRVLAGAQEQQISDMRALGLEADVVLLQSRFKDRHAGLFEEAIRSNQVYACDCSRKEVQAALMTMASAPHNGAAPVYSGHCRDLPRDRKLVALDSIAWRFKMPDSSGHDDFIVARSSTDLNSGGLPERGTFTPAYHWACAIDDYDGGYELLVRSSDLAAAGVLQRAIHRWVAQHEGQIAPPARVFLTSLIVQNDGHRLEKRTKGVTLDELITQKIEVDTLRLKFQKSFDSEWINQGIKSFDVASEAQTTMTLAELID